MGEHVQWEYYLRDILEEMIADGDFWILQNLDVEALRDLVKRSVELLRHEREGNDA